MSNMETIIQQHTAYIRKLKQAGAAAFIEAHSANPSVDVGLFTYDEWQPNKTYTQGDLFTYNGQPGFVRAASINSLEAYPPFSLGTESLYGARPRQKTDGTYPYIYNMKSEIGMKVRSEKDGELYEAIQNADPLLFDPADVPALFTKI